MELTIKPNTAEKLGINPFEAADYMQSDEDCAQYLQACFEDAPGIRCCSPRRLVTRPALA